MLLTHNSTERFKMIDCSLYCLSAPKILCPYLTWPMQKQYTTAGAQSFALVSFSFCYFFIYIVPYGTSQKVCRFLLKQDKLDVCMYFYIIMV